MNRYLPIVLTLLTLISLPSASQAAPDKGILRLCAGPLASARREPLCKEAVTVPEALGTYAMVGCVSDLQAPAMVALTAYLDDKLSGNYSSNLPAAPGVRQCIVLDMPTLQPGHHRVDLTMRQAGTSRLVSRETFLVSAVSTDQGYFLDGVPFVTPKIGGGNADAPYFVLDSGKRNVLLLGQKEAHLLLRLASVKVPSLRLESDVWYNGMRQGSLTGPSVEINNTEVGRHHVALLIPLNNLQPGNYELRVYIRTAAGRRFVSAVPLAVVRSLGLRACRADSAAAEKPGSFSCADTDGLVLSYQDELLIEAGLEYFNQPFRFRVVLTSPDTGTRTGTTFAHRRSGKGRSFMRHIFKDLVPGSYSLKVSVVVQGVENGLAHLKFTVTD